MILISRHCAISLRSEWLLKSRNKTGVSAVQLHVCETSLYTYLQYALGIISTVLKWQVCPQEAGRTFYCLKN